jgi:hypothetical protein
MICRRVVSEKLLQKEDDEQELTPGTDIILLSGF